MGIRNCLYTLSLVLFLMDSALGIEVSCEREMELGQFFLSEGDYTSALYQFKRIEKLCEEKALKERAEYLVAVTYLLLDRDKEAQKQLLQIMEMDQHSYKEQSAFMLSFAIEKDERKAEAYILGLLDYRIRNEAIKDALKYRLAWLYMGRGDLKRAEEYLKGIEYSSELKLSAMEILRDSGQYSELPFKSPPMAGLLSGIIPGLGQLYVGRPRDGITAFLVNALFIGATVQAFGKDQDFLGVMLGFVELGWYAGNIYNAANSAHKYNRKVREDFLGRFQNRLQLKALVGDKGEVGVLLGLRF